MPATTPRFAELQAPAHWRVVDFISDLHLQACEPETVQAWAHYLARTHADAIFILGDLFEVWVGDDGQAGDDEDARFERHCLEHMRAASTRHALHFMHGNRDFLFGATAADRAGCALLADPTVLHFGAQRWLLSHGDLLCLDDADYLRFRAQVRTASWQTDFLAQPLAQRRAVARGLREQSEQRKRSGASYADVDAGMTLDWLDAAGAATLIHGHTHKPADHPLDGGRRRLVLSDWDAAATPARAEVLRLSLEQDTVQIRRLAASQAG